MQKGVRPSTIAVVMLSTLLLFVGFTSDENIQSLHSLGEQHFSRVRLAALTQTSAKMLTVFCNRMDANASLNLPEATIESRHGSELALLFATSTHYSFCLSESSGDSLTRPVEITQRAMPINELESVGELNKVKGMPLYTTDEWFVVRVNSGIATLKVVTRGWSTVTAIHHGFALIHETGRASPGIRGFSYGLVVGFNVRGGFVASASLR